jgi:hypothetical protein
VTTISRTLSILAATSIILTGCGKKSVSELAEEERAKLKTEKRAKAAEAYKTLADNYPNDEKAQEAGAKAAALAQPAK